MTLTNIGTEVCLPHPQHGYQGATAVTIDAADECICTVLRMPKTGTLQYVLVRCVAAATPSTVNVRIETIDGANGQPTGSLAYTNATGSFTSAANTYFWVAINSTTGVAVTKNDLVGIRVIQTDGSCTVIASSSTIFYEQQGFPYYLQYIGSTWTKGSVAPFGAVQIDGAIVYISGMFGSTVAATATINTGTTPDHAGNKFMLPFGCRAVGCWATANFTAAANMILYGSDGTTVLATSWEPDPDIRSVAGVYTMFFYFTSTVELTASTYYRLALVPTSGSNVGMGYIDVSDNGAVKGIDALELGQNCVYTYCTDAPANEASWTQTTTRRALCGIIIDQIDIPAGGIKSMKGMYGGLQ